MQLPVYVDERYCICQFSLLMVKITIEKTVSITE